MEDSEALDLDSLVELLDNDFDEEVAPITSKANSAVKEPIKETLTPRPTAKRSLELRDMFEKSLSPQKVKFPKKDIPYDEYPSYKQESIVYSKECNEDPDEEFKGLSEFGRCVQKQLNHQERERKPSSLQPKVSSWNQLSSRKNITEINKSGSSCFVDTYSGIRIVNPLVSFDVMQQRMQGRRMIKMSFMGNFIRNGDIEGDWVTVGVLVGKLPPKETKTGKPFSIWKMTDLHDPEKILSVFLFGKAHADHWKTTIGTVMGILNPKMSPEKGKNGEISLTVDHPGKFLLMGKSKDLGRCKSKRKDGSPCTSIVNLAQCEYCLYHVKREYQKFSGGRSELQAVYTGKEPNLKSKLLKKQNIIYGGQMYVPSDKKATSKVKSKDKLTLSNLTLKRKAEALENETRESGVKKITEMFGPEMAKTAENNSEFINNQLTIPSAGSRNLLQHLMKDKAAKSTERTKIISPKELLKMRDTQFRSPSQNKRDDSLTLRNLTPQLGRGLLPGQKVALDSPHLSTVYNPLDIAKLKAIKRIQEKGTLKPQDPNSVKVSDKAANKVKAALERSFEEKKDSSEEEHPVAKSKLGSIDLNSERVKEMLNRKSSHSYEVEVAEMEREAAYFNALEKKEKMEEKMASIKEIVCDVFSCKKCKYTAHTAAERCKRDGHPLKSHKALKRFFACVDCKTRTVAFKRYPSRTCSECNGSNFERTSMLRKRKGPLLPTEVLNIRGDETKFLHSLSTVKCDAPF